MNLEECLIEYVENCKPFIKPRTLITYNDKIPAIIKIIGNLDINDITQEYLQTKIIEQQNLGKTQTSIKNWLTLTLCCLKPYKSFNRFRYKLATQDLKKKEIYSQEDLTKIENYIFSQKKSTYLPIIIAINTGMRLSEIVALKWEDIAFDNKQISVNKSIFYDHHSNKFVTQTPKSKSGYRNIPMTNNLYNYLLKIEHTNNNHYVITNSEQPRNSRGIQRTNKLLLKKLGVKYLGFHTYRHSFATYLTKSTKDFKAVSEILGHSGITITQNIYNHPTDEQKQNIMANTFNNTMEKLKVEELESRINVLKNELNTLLNELTNRKAFLK